MTPLYLVSYLTRKAEYYAVIFLTLFVTYGNFTLIRLSALSTVVGIKFSRINHTDTSDKHHYWLHDAGVLSSFSRERL